MGTRITGELPAEEVEHELYAVHRWERDGRNHLFDRAQDGAGVGAVWTKCTRGKAIPRGLASRMSCPPSSTTTTRRTA